MPEWLDLSATWADPPLTTLAVRLALAWLCGWLIAQIARREQAAADIRSLTLTLVLLSVLISMATQIIGDNIARAFSLVGALSIVRFRTAVPSTRDVAFVLAAVVVGMAVGAGQYWIAAMGIPTIALATGIESLTNRTTQVQHVSISETTPAVWRLNLQSSLYAAGGWEEVLHEYAVKFTLQSVETARRGSTIELVYHLEWGQAQRPVELLAALNALPPVEAVALKQVC